MTNQMLIVFGVLVGAIGLFAWGRPRADIVAILVVLALLLTRVLTPQESLAGFGDPVSIRVCAPGSMKRLYPRARSAARSVATWCYRARD
jgi:di/tricarboxylate transporter